MEMMKKAAGMKVFSFVAAMCISTAVAAETYNTAVDATYAPHAMRDLSGKLVGFNIDLAAELAKEMGATINVDGVELNAILPGLNSKKYDFVVAPITATLEQANALLFTEGYLNSQYSFVVKKSAADIKSIEELKGKVVAVNKGNPLERWLQANQDKYGYLIESYSTNADAIQAVLAGRAYANMATMPVTSWAAKQNPLLKVATYSINSGNVVAISFRKNDEALRAKFSNALKCLKQKGVIVKLSQKWFDVTPAADSASVKIGVGTGIQNFPGYDPTPVTLTCAK